MDVSQEYILMCEKAVEIQEQKPDFESEECNYVANFHHAKACPTHGQDHLWTKYLQDDFYCCTCGKELVDVDHIPSFEQYEQNRAYKTVWLLRQDQLQEMAHWGGRSVGELLWIFARWQDERGEDGLYAHQFTSFEQLWLAFVMDTIYNKTWNGDDWKSAV